MKKVTKRQLASALRRLKKAVKQLEDWQDGDRTVTPVELSKICPGWFDN